MPSEAKCSTCGETGFCKCLLDLLVDDGAPTKPPEAVKVTQGDVEIANRIVDGFRNMLSAAYIAPASEKHWLADTVARHREEAEKRVAAGPWTKVGTFEPIPDASYLVQGTLCLSVKLGRDIDDDNVCAALIGDHIQENSDIMPSVSRDD